MVLLCLTSGTTYFVRAVDDNTLELYDTALTHFYRLLQVEET